MNLLGRIAVIIITSVTACAAYCLIDNAIDNAEKQYEIKSKGKDYYYQRRYLSYVDDDGQFHETIGNGCYVIWPSKDLYLEAQKRN